MIILNGQGRRGTAGKIEILAETVWPPGRRAGMTDVALALHYERWKARLPPSLVNSLQLERRSNLATAGSAFWPDRLARYPLQSSH